MDVLENTQKIAIENIDLARNSQLLLIAKLDKQFDEIVRLLSTKYL